MDCLKAGNSAAFEIGKSPGSYHQLVGLLPVEEEQGFQMLLLH